MTEIENLLLKQPINRGATHPGGCIPLCWYADPSSGVIGHCPQKLIINPYTSGSNLHIATQISGRSLVGDFCSGSDSYVTFTSPFSHHIDIWGARRDGVWYSSVTIDVYTQNTNASQNETIQAMKSAACQYKTKTNTTPYGAGTCGAYALFGTVTVNDDGTITFA
jgi:hypothetical protein